ncbi:InlB B-repeat-containing protein [Bifidobacterium sp. H6bp9]|uniref:InlB B-repeat-containing protein n=1 Tax=Bifidobacterium sp. H6bp9 TaxID=3051961 RepID=UPI0028BE3BED|nr:InlB B-repeat-containing protein [Bifidobacterium sp. H6bp9]MDT7511694.1 InlB B-repeat-containing protein [Bifidobacterium sp. H6bp9]
MNIMVRFKRACAVLAAGATLAGGLALLPTVAQAVESKNVQTKAGGHTVVFNDFGADEAHAKITMTTDEQGKLDPARIPEPTVYPEIAQQNMKADGWTLSAMGPDAEKIDFATHVFTDDLTEVYPHFVQIKPTPTPTYTITFITMNPADPEDVDNSYADQIKTNDKRELIREPEVHPYDGYTFDGWFSDNGGSRYAAGGTYTADTTFRARYTKVTTPNEPNKPRQTAPVDNNTKQPAKDPAKKDTKNNNTLAQTGADAVAPLAIAAGLCLAAGITLGLRRKLAL